MHNKLVKSNNIFFKLILNFRARIKELIQVVPLREVFRGFYRTSVILPTRIVVLSSK